ncbi:hypothetical protein EC988_005121 [Linderina pennispora]|nr:hypothetical protein EC988_005121 [Linderina pennispora]
MQEPRGAMVAAGPIRGSAPPVHGPAPSHTTQQHNSLVQRPPARPLQPPAPQPPAPQPPAPQPPASLPAHRAHARMGSGGSIPAGHSASQQPTAQPAVPAAPAVSSRGGRHDRSRQTQTPDGTANPELLDDEAREAHEALMKRRKRNAQSAARLRERRKNREQELFSSCQRLESQILQLEEELADEKQRAIKDIRRREPDPAAIEDNLQAGGIPETRQEKTNKRQRTDDGEAGGKRTRPMRELDQVRLDDLRSKIATLGKLNQQVCVNLGVLRQEIRRISQTIITQKDGQQSATAA